MRRAPALALLLLPLLLAGCTSPFTPYPTSPLPEVRAVIDVAPYDSDENGQTDGIRLRLRSAQPAPPLVGSDAVLFRNGDGNVTVWKCSQRETIRCAGPGNRGILSWDVNEDIFIRGLPGANRISVMVRERYEFNTTVRVQETRDTEVWAVFEARPYDSDGNRTADGIEINLLDSDKAPFAAGEIAVYLNQVRQPVYSDPRRVQESTGLVRGGKVFVDGFIGDNRLEVVLRATRLPLGTFILGE